MLAALALLLVAAAAPTTTATTLLLNPDTLLRHNETTIGLHVPEQLAVDGSETFRNLISAYLLGLRAVQDDASLLPGTRLSYALADSGNTAAGSFQASLDLGAFCQGTPVTAILGADNSRIAASAANVATVMEIPHLSAFSSADSLSDDSTYPYFARLFPADESQAAALAALIRSFGWKQVSVLASDELYGTSFTSAFLTHAAAEGITVAIVQFFQVGQVNNVSPQLEAIRAAGARVHVLVTGSSYASTVLTQIEEASLKTDSHVWLGPDGWADLGVTEAMLGTIRISGRVNTSTPQYQQLQALFDSVPATERFNSTGVLSFPYDTVLLFAHALNSTLDALEACARNSSAETDAVLARLGVDRATNCSYFFSSETTDADTLMFFISRTEFDGATGYVKMLPNGDRRGEFEVYNSFDSSANCIVAPNEDGTESGTLMTKVVGTVLGRDVDLQLPVTFAEARCSVPSDTPDEVDVEVDIDDEALVAMYVMLALGVLLTLGVIGATLAYRDSPVVQMSSYRINIFSAIGTLVFLFSMLTMSMTSTAACHATTYLLALGFAFTVGPLFAKTYRVHSIFNAESIAQAKTFSDSEIAVHVFGAALVDVIVLTLWLLLDPMTAERSGIRRVQPTLGSDMVEVRYHLSCKSDNALVFATVILVYKCVYVLFTTFLAWNVRNVDIRALNDSKWIGFSMYNMIFVAIVVIPVSSLWLEDDVTARFIMRAVGVFWVVCVTNTFMHVPKFVAIARGDEMDWVRRSTTTGPNKNGIGKGNKDRLTPHSHLSTNHSGRESPRASEMRSPATPAEALREAAESGHEPVSLAGAVVDVDGPARVDKARTSSASAARAPSTTHQRSQSESRPSVGRPASVMMELPTIPGQVDRIEADIIMRRTGSVRQYQPKDEEGQREFQRLRDQNAQLLAMVRELQDRIAYFDRTPEDGDDDDV